MAQRSSLFNPTQPYAAKQGKQKTQVHRRHRREKWRYRGRTFKAWLRFFATFEVKAPAETKPHRIAPQSRDDLSKLKVAIVADWLTNMGGAERVVLSLHKAFPQAPIYTSVFEPSKMPLFAGLDIRTTYLQRLPRKLRARHQLFPVLRDRAFRHLDLDAYDVVISSSSAEAKAVITPVSTTHICYCHTPIRYYWSHYREYLKDPGFGFLNPIIRLIMPGFVRLMRRADRRAVHGVDHFIANSSEVQARIQKYYQRQSTIIYPPVEVDRFATVNPPAKQDFYLLVGRQIPYKKHDLAIAACNKLGKRLIVIGNGSEHDKLVKMAGPTVEFKTGVDDQEIVRYFQEAKALLWPQLEDFGVVAIEAMAAGTPVIAYKGGGALDFVDEGKTGVFFDDQTPDSLAQAITTFEDKRFKRRALIDAAAKYSEARFIDEIQEFVFETTRQKA